MQQRRERVGLGKDEEGIQGFVKEWLERRGTGSETVKRAI